MPDGDKIPVGLSGPWRKVFHSFAARDSNERIEDRVVGALASDLRRVGGVPGLEKLVGPDAIQLAGTRHDQVTDAIALAVSEHLALSSPPIAARALIERIISEAALTEWSIA